MRIALALIPVIALSGCVERIAESRIRTALVAQGLSEDYAGCMAGRMAHRLSLGQLRKLEHFQGGRGKGGIAALSFRLQALGDPEIVGVVASAAARCALR